MPVYEFRCEGCGKLHEFILKMSDRPVMVCPDCGGDLKKMISNTSFVLKGSGWYADGYSSCANNDKTEAKSEAKPESKSDAKPETKSEAKTETAAAPKKEAAAA